MRGSYSAVATEGPGVGAESKAFGVAVGGLTGSSSFGLGGTCDGGAAGRGGWGGAPSVGPGGTCGRGVGVPSGDTKIWRSCFPWNAGVQRDSLGDQVGVEGIRAQRVLAHG